MSGLLSGITDLLFGKPEAPAADFDTIEKLIKLGDLYSNPTQRGIFSGWETEIGPDGRLIQTQNMNPQLQPAMDSFMGRLNEGSNDPQLDQLKGAMFQQMMSRSGPSAMPQRRQRPMNRSQFTDEEGNSIRSPDWWHRGQ